MKTSPCKDCQDRHEGCHGHCKLYIEWSAMSHGLLKQISRDKTDGRYVEFWDRRREMWKK